MKRCVEDSKFIHVTCDLSAKVWASDITVLTSSLRLIGVLVQGYYRASCILYVRVHKNVFSRKRDRVRMHKLARDPWPLRRVNHESETPKIPRLVYDRTVKMSFTILRCKQGSFQDTVNWIERAWFFNFRSRLSCTHMRRNPTGMCSFI